MSGATLPQKSCRYSIISLLLCAIFCAPLLASAQSRPSNSSWPLTVVIVDESGSMKNRDAPEWLQNHLIASVGDGDIMYGLVAFSDKARVIDSGTGTLWPAAGLAAGIGELDLTRGLEDGLSAIQFTMKEFGVFPDAAAHYLLVTDEDRDVVDARIDTEELADELAAAGAVLDAMISVSLRCDGVRAIGLEHSGVAYIADGKGGYRTCVGGIVQDLANSPVKDYVLLALGSGGTVWDIGMTGWRVEGKAYPALNSPKRKSAVAAFQAASLAHWKRRLEQPLVASVRAKPLLTSVGSVIELDASASVSRDVSREIAQFEWLVNGAPTTAGETAVVVAEKAGLMRITLRVTDSGFPPRVTEDTVTVWVRE